MRNSYRVQKLAVGALLSILVVVSWSVDVRPELVLRREGVAVRGKGPTYDPCDSYPHVMSCASVAPNQTGFCIEDVDPPNCGNNNTCEAICTGNANKTVFINVYTGQDYTVLLGGNTPIECGPEKDFLDNCSTQFGGNFPYCGCRNLMPNGNVCSVLSEESAECETVENGGGTTVYHPVENATKMIVLAYHERLLLRCR